MPAEMNPGTFLIILASVAMSACAQLLLKLGVAAAKAAGWQGGPSVLFNPMVFAGFALYGLGAVLWLYVLARLPLSAAYPFVGIGFIFTMLLGVTVLGESLGALRIAGTLAIALGCVLVARSAG
ncbi:MAG: small multi-drug resistant family protein [Proteobacteria bacterium]|nr:small multi-drug resistant family protein [Pseudomonadota bacterium]